MIDNRLKDVREEIDISQIEMGKHCGVKKATISNWENGYSIIPLKHLATYSNYTNHSLDYICGFTRKNKKLPKITSANINSIGDNLKKFRESLKLSQQAFSDKCNIPQSTYSHYEIGYKLILTINLYSICKTFKVSMDYLFGRTNDKKI